MTRKEESSKRKALRLSCTLRREGAVHVASCLEVPASGCAATAEEALVRLRRALELYFSDGGPVPDELLPSVEYIDLDLPARSAKRSRRAGEQR